MLLAYVTPLDRSGEEKGSLPEEKERKSALGRRKKRPHDHFGAVYRTRRREAIEGLGNFGG